MKSNIKRFLIENSSAIILLVLFLVLTFVDSSLFSIRNIRNIGLIGAPRLIVACAFALCMYAGVTNISLAFIAGLAGILVSSFFQTGESSYILFSSTQIAPLAVVIIVVILLMCLIGVLHVLLIHVFSFPSFMADIGMIGLVYGIMYVYLHDSIQGEVFLDGFSKAFRDLGTASIGSDPTYSLPFSILISILICIGLLFLFKKVPFYNRIILSNKKNVSIQKKETLNTFKPNLSFLELLFIFCCATIISSFGGILQVSYAGSVGVDFGLSFLFDVLAICLISGFSVFGNKGKLPLLIIGTFIYTSACYAVDFVGWGRFTPYIIRAFIILLCIGIDISFRRKVVSIVETSEEKSDIESKSEQISKSDVILKSEQDTTK